MSHVVDIKEMKNKLNANLMNNELQQKDNNRNFKETKIVVYTIFQIKNKKNFKEAQNIICKGNRFSININLFKLILFK